MASDLRKQVQTSVTSLTPLTLDMVKAKKVIK
jgi:hypothetical protein